VLGFKEGSRTVFKSRIYWLLQKTTKIFM
jgi:hypothetical protein